ncbi:Hypothetical predicted protein, partial [Drosophila guanche]
IISFLLCRVMRQRTKPTFLHLRADKEQSSGQRTGSRPIAKYEPSGWKWTEAATSHKIAVGMSDSAPVCLTMKASARAGERRRPHVPLADFTHTPRGVHKKCNAALFSKQKQNTGTPRQKQNKQKTARAWMLCGWWGGRRGNILFTCRGMQSAKLPTASVMMMMIVVVVLGDDVEWWKLEVVAPRQSAAGKSHFDPIHIDGQTRNAFHDEHDNSWIALVLFSSEIYGNGNGNGSCTSPMPLHLCMSPFALHLMEHTEPITSYQKHAKNPKNFNSLCRLFNPALPSLFPILLAKSCQKMFALEISTHLLKRNGQRGRERD